MVLDNDLLELPKADNYVILSTIKFVPQVPIKEFAYVHTNNSLLDCFGDCGSQPISRSIHYV